MQAQIGTQNLTFLTITGVFTVFQLQNMFWKPIFSTLNLHIIWFHAVVMSCDARFAMQTVVKVCQISLTHGLHFKNENKKIVMISYLVKSMLLNAVGFAVVGQR